LDCKTPGYLIREETKRKKLRERTGERILKKGWRGEREVDENMLEGNKSEKQRGQNKLRLGRRKNRKHFFENRE